MREKVMVIGWDGATWDVLSPLVKKGKMPNLKKLMDKGFHTELKSTLPTISPVAWTSFYTGNNPQKHGIYNFLKKSGNNFKSVTSDNVKKESVWEILSQNGESSIVMNVPMTYPPKRISGKMISGFLSPPNSNYTYPKNLQKKMEDRGYRIEAEIGDFSEKNKEDILRIFKRTMKNRTEVALDLVNKNNWSLFVLVYTGLDRVQHYFWKEFEESSEDEISTIERYYIELDKELGRLMDESPQNASIILMSDHGFGRLEGEVYINTWLQRIGFLSYKKTSSSIFSKIGITQQNLFYFLRKLKLFNFFQRIIKKIGLYGKKNKIPKPKLSDIDFSRTRAYAMNYGGQIYINKDLVDNCESFRNNISKGLEKLRNPKTNEKVIKEVHKINNRNNSPDLLIESENYDAVGFLGHRQIVNLDPEKSGTHRKNGIIVINSKDSIQKEKFKEARIIDVTPTILDLLDLKPPKNIEGASLVKN